MCGRYSLTLTRDQLADRFDVSLDGFEPRYNCAPGQSLPVVTARGGERMEWGLVPSWAEDHSTSFVNARSETIADRRSFAEAFERRRCLVPADGFYEWTDEGPYRVAFEGDRPFAMAGIWERWTPPSEQASLGDFGTGTPDPEPRETFAVVTTDANDLIRDLHDRMAVVLDLDEVDPWLHGSTSEAERLIEPYPADEMRAYRVTSRVNDPANDDPGLVEPVES